MISSISFLFVNFITIFLKNQPIIHNYGYVFGIFLFIFTHLYIILLIFMHLCIVFLVNFKTKVLSGILLSRQDFL